MLIGGDDISNDVTSFSMFVYISRSFPLRADWRKPASSVDGEPQGTWRRIFSLQRRSRQTAPESLLAGYDKPSQSPTQYIFSNLQLYLKLECRLYNSCNKLAIFVRFYQRLLLSTFIQVLLAGKTLRQMGNVMD